MLVAGASCIAHPRTARRAAGQACYPPLSRRRRVSGNDGSPPSRAPLLCFSCGHLGRHEPAPVAVTKPDVRPALPRLVFFPEYSGCGDIVRRRLRQRLRQRALVTVPAACEMPKTPSQKVRLTTAGRHLLPQMPRPQRQGRLLGPRFVRPNRPRLPRPGSAPLPDVEGEVRAPCLRQVKPHIRRSKGEGEGSRQAAPEDPSRRDE